MEKQSCTNFLCKIKTIQCMNQTSQCCTALLLNDCKFQQHPKLSREFRLLYNLNISACMYSLRKKKPYFTKSYCYSHYINVNISTAFRVFYNRCIFVVSGFKVYRLEKGKRPFCIYEMFLKTQDESILCIFNLVIGHVSN